MKEKFIMPESNFDKDLIREFIDKKYTSDMPIVQELKSEYLEILDSENLEGLKKLIKTMEVYVDYHLEKSRDDKEFSDFLEKLEVEKKKIKILVKEKELNSDV